MSDPIRSTQAEETEAQLKAAVDAIETQEGLFDVPLIIKQMSPQELENVGLPREFHTLSPQQKAAAVRARKGEDVEPEEIGREEPVPHEQGGPGGLGVQSSEDGKFHPNEADSDGDGEPDKGNPGDENPEPADTDDDTDDDPDNPDGDESEPVVSQATQEYDVANEFDPTPSDEAPRHAHDFSDGTAPSDDGAPRPE